MIITTSNTSPGPPPPRAGRNLLNLLTMYALRGGRVTLEFSVALQNLFTIRAHVYNIDLDNRRASFTPWSMKPEPRSMPGDFTLLLPLDGDYDIIPWKGCVGILFEVDEDQHVLLRLWDAASDDEESTVRAIGEKACDAAEPKPKPKAGSKPKLKQVAA